MMMCSSAFRRPGFSRVAGGRPLARRLAAVPVARREAEHLAVDAAALEHAREDFDGQRRDLHRPAAHRARVIDEQRDDRARETASRSPA